MSSRRVALEDFGSPKVEAQERVAPGPPLSEEERLAAFEQGYKAGWEDSAAALEGEHKKLSTDLSQNLRDLSFSYHEAQSAMIAGVEAVLRTSMQRLLPALASEALPQLVLERLEPLMREAAGIPIVLLVAPSSRASVAAVLPQDPGLPLELREDPELSDGQAYIRAGEIEHAFDLDGALAEIEGAVTDFFSLQEEKAAANG